MKVLKFGGTSVGTVESLRHVKRIVEECEEQVIVVVSALGGITDLLINMIKIYVLIYLASKILCIFISVQRQADFRKQAFMLA